MSRPFEWAKSSRRRWAGELTRINCSSRAWGKANHDHEAHRRAFSTCTIRLIHTVVTKMLEILKIPRDLPVLPSGIVTLSISYCMANQGAGVVRCKKEQTYGIYIFCIFTSLRLVPSQTVIQYERTAEWNGMNLHISNHGR